MGSTELVEPLRGVDTLAALAAKQALDAEERRRLPAETVAALVDAGFARYFVPPAYLPVPERDRLATWEQLARAVAAVAEGCASTAWIASILASVGRMAAYLPEEGRDEFWATGPDTVGVGALVPTGRATPVSGGWRVTGEWALTSGIDHADWVLACARVVSGELRFFALPSGGFTILDTWFNVGMRGTGSNTMVVEDLFVPEHRTFRHSTLMAGHDAVPGVRGYDLPLPAVSPLLFAAPALGAAMGLLRWWTAWTGQRSDPFGVALRGKPGPQQLLARVAGELDAAALLLDRVARTADGGGVDALTAARSARDCALAVESIVGVVDRLFHACGTRGQATNSPAQRVWRDVHSIAAHVGLQVELTGAAYAAKVWPPAPPG
ncbi:acyl-CoA dehydrogenase family protein [Catellatospora tritici]|uniref:acyl-CoA dehydrogenase family protein n=1 Tax=Catellatospora tritici TaxID=2851566 RepID=UPI001C2D7CC9|nr:acyl-CoA dehydrogenase family protein [Catellatospora tritici]MBV1855589.1 hydrolase [Catellatospora tritici]